MIIKLFNLWYFLWLLIAAGFVVGLYFLLRHKSQKTKKIVLFSLLALGVLLHFLKALIPPYSTNTEILWREIWFTNICGANIILFPFIFLSKSNRAKDYMVYVGIISGLLALLYPVEPIQKANQMAEWLDIVRFYYHHTMIFGVPLLTVLLKVHTLDYKRVWSVPIYFMGVLAFIMTNQIIQSELGYVALRNANFLNINYKNPSLIWGPGNEAIGELFKWLCPPIFKTVPVGEFAGQEKYWPLIWLLIPVFVYFIPLSF